MYRAKNAARYPPKHAISNETNHLYNFFPSLSYFIEFRNVYELKKKFAIKLTDRMDL